MLQRCAKGAAFLHQREELGGALLQSGFDLGVLGRRRVELVEQMAYAILHMLCHGFCGLGAVVMKPEAVGALGTGDGEPADHQGGKG
ncbi:MAG: hypothetical protein RL385_6061, partial [Pseudomonadota bacterium]